MEKTWTCEEDILCGVNEPKDKSNPTDLEKKHIPVIEAPDKVKKDEPFEVKIEVGKPIHYPPVEIQIVAAIEWLESIVRNKGIDKQRVIDRIKELNSVNTDTTASDTECSTPH